MFSLLEPYYNDVPDHIELSLPGLSAEVCAFNRRGTLLAIGTTDGQVIVWDVETRAEAKRFTGHHYDKINSVSWSLSGRYILSASDDGRCCRWDVLAGSLSRIIQVAAPYHHMKLCQLHPRNPSLAVLSSPPNQPVLLHLDTLNDGSKAHVIDTHSVATTPALTPDLSPIHSFVTPINYALADDSLPSNEDGDATKTSDATAADEQTMNDSNGTEEKENTKFKKPHKRTGRTQNEVYAIATYDRYGQHLLAGTSNGSIVVHDAVTMDVLQTLERAGMRSSNIIQISLNRQNNKLAVTNAGGAIRLFAKDAETNQYTFVRMYQDSITRRKWAACVFNGTSDYLIAVSNDNASTYAIHIWQADIYSTGALLKVLSGRSKSGESITDITCHPTRPLLATPLDPSGSLHIWSKHYAQNWTAFAPDFEELPNNEEYIEREDEFDIKPPETSDDHLYATDVDIVDVTSSSTAVGYLSDDEPDQVNYLPIEITADEAVTKRYNDRLQAKRTAVEQRQKAQTEIAERSKPQIDTVPQPTPDASEPIKQNGIIASANGVELRATSTSQPTLTAALPASATAADSTSTADHEMTAS